MTYTPGIPVPTNDPSVDAPVMQQNSIAINNWVQVDHVGFNNASSGQHKQVTFQSNNVPSIPTTPPVLFTNIQDGAGNNLPGGIAELFFYSGSALQGQGNYVSQIQGSVMLFGGIILKWGNLSVPNGGSAPFTFPGGQFPNACFACFTTTRSIGAFKSGIGVPAQNQVTVYLEAAAGGPQTVYVIGIGN